jgi:hypothetical protein
MSGCTGNKRIASRDNFKEIFKSYLGLLSNFDGFVEAVPSGSYNSDETKTTFGDMDLIVHIDYTKNKVILAKVQQALLTQKYSPSLIKREIKKELARYLVASDKTLPFVSEKHNGKLFYNAGELITVSYKDTLDACQIDNMIALTHKEFEFKSKFLDLSAEKQGLMLGLVKTIFIEQPLSSIEDILDMSLPPLANLEEYEFTLSSRCLTLRIVHSIYSTKDRTDLKEYTDFGLLTRLLSPYDFNKEFKDIVDGLDFTYDRSAQRVEGIFKSMITVKSGEVDTPKGQTKIDSLEYLKKGLL